MGAVIKVNGMEVPESLAIIDTANNTVTLQTMLISEQELDVDKIHAEVNQIGRASCRERVSSCV